MSAPGRCSKRPASLGDFAPRALRIAAPLAARPSAVTVLEDAAPDHELVQTIRTATMTLRA
jgi:hypothetical protein